MHLRDRKQEVLEEVELLADLCDYDLSRHDLFHVIAKGRLFHKVSFKQAALTECYFRNCRFVECDFTGATIKGTNLRGAQFEGCTFRYTTWEKSPLDDEFLDNCLPSEENLARDLVRSLRVNFAETGNYAAVNKAASIEVRLTGEHLYKAAYSRQSYYRLKYKGWHRASHAFRHARWKAFDLVWGNGESVGRIVVSSIAVVLACAAIYAHDSQRPFADALLESLWHFWGRQHARAMPPIYALALAITQFFALGLFIAVLVKRLSHR